MTLRDEFLTECCAKKQGVTIIVQNGYQIKGIVLDYDESAILFSREDRRRMLIFQGVVSSIIPHEPISMTERKTRQ